MTAWTGVIAPFGVVVLLVGVPGLVLGWLAGLRGLLLAGAAAPLSVAVVAGSAVVAGQLPGGLVRWTVLVPLAVTALAGAALVVARRWFPQLSPREASRAQPAATTTGRHTAVRPDSRPPSRPAGRSSRPASRPRRGARRPSGRTVVAVVASVLGAALVAVQFRRAVISPDLVSQSADVLFHLNAVRWVLDGGDASSLHLQRMTSPGADLAFYPGAWTDLVALVVQLTGTSIPVATQLVAMACAALVWPLSAVVLAERVLPRTPAGSGGVLAAGLLTGAVPAFPWLALSWGVLYPTLLAMAVLPAVVALVVVLVRRLVPASGATEGDDDGGGPVVVLLVVLVVVTAGLGLAHPSAVAALVVVAGPLVGAAAVRALRRGWSDPVSRRLSGLVAAVVVLAGLVAALLLRRSSLLTSVSQYQWPSDTTLAQAVGEALLLQPAGTLAPALLLAVLVVVGALAAWRRGQGWLAVGWAVSAVLFVIAEVTSSNPLTGPWYNDTNRLAVLLALPAVLLGASGAVALAEGAARLVRAAPPAKPVLARSVLVLPAVPVVVALAVVVGPANGMTAARGEVQRVYPVFPGADPSWQMVSVDELALFRRVADDVPAGAVIANDPFQGTSLAYAWSGREVLFPHLTGRWTDDQLLLAGGLDRVGTDPEVCAAARRTGVEYLIDSPPQTYDLPKGALFTGMHAAPASGAFTLVDEVGTAKLYELTTCAGA